MKSRALLALAVTAIAGLWGVGGPIRELSASARADTARPPHAANSPATKAHPRAGARRAPSSPPLAPAGEVTGAEEGASASAMSSAGDPLISNGLGSPLCRSGEADLSAASQSNCRSSGFEAASEPTGNYAFDVHINTGVTKWGNDGAAWVQNLLQLGWTVLVASVHGIVVMLEWCYTIDLLDSSAMSGVARGLRETQATFTQPWLVVVLAVASVLALYHGLVRRRVAETVGQALLMLAMMAGGLWVIMNPTGTVGALGEWANDAGLGALGAAAGGTPSHPDRTLADSMGSIFSGAVGTPWCFMEFGDVGWCDDPARLDPRLHAAGLTAASLERAQIGCQSSSGPFATCAQPGSVQARALQQSVQQLREARTNGALFLALPANQAIRNSINDQGSLFNVLCGGSEMPCKGPTAAEAEFRTEHGTLWRFMGLVFIWVGALGMLLLLGFIGMHLLGAAIASLLYLLLAPAAVLAPALGDGGRTAFRAWSTRLLGAVMSKLIYSFVLGVGLLMEQILTVDLTALGWFTQWLLTSVMWWGAFTRRHQVLSFAHGGHAQQREPRSLARRVSGALETPSAVWRNAARARTLFAKQGQSVENRNPRAEAARERAKADSAEQVGRTLEHDHRDARARLEEAPEIQERLSARRAQLERVRGEHGRALSSGDTRRALELEHRAQRIEGDIERSQQGLNAARQLTSDSEHVRRAGGGLFTPQQADERARFLDAQAALPASAQARGLGAGERRDYAALAALAGYGREEYEQLDPRSRRSARREIDRELAMRRELNATAAEVAAKGNASHLKNRERRKLDKAFDSTLRQRLRDGGHGLPSSRIERSAIDSWREVGRTDPGSSESRVMRDAHAVAARRKRQLGWDSDS